MPLCYDDEGIGFLLADVSRLLRRDFDRRVRALSLTQVQWRAIAHLVREDGIRQAALADRLDIAPITLGRLVDRLEAAGWVRRAADPEDRRASRLFLTAKAEPILEEIRVHAMEARADLMDGISIDAQRRLVETLRRMKQNLVDRAATADEGAPESVKQRTTR